MFFMLVLFDMVWLLIGVYDPVCFSASLFVVLPTRVSEGLIS